MDYLAILEDQLRAIERLYASAAAVFVETKRKIEAGEEPWEPPPFNPETDSVEPPYLEEWIEAEEFQDVVGQMCLSLAHACLKDFLKGVVERAGIADRA